MRYVGKEADAGGSPVMVRPPIIPTSPPTQVAAVLMFSTQKRSFFIANAHVRKIFKGNEKARSRTRTCEYEGSSEVLQPHALAAWRSAR